MTLLESIVALVILGLAAVGFLELFQRASAATLESARWSHAVSVAELTMERSILAPQALQDTLDGVERRVVITPWRNGVREIVVSIAVPPSAGAGVVLHRLVSAP